MKEELYVTMAKKKLYNDTIALFKKIVKSDRVVEDTIVLSFEEDKNRPQIRGKYLNQNGEQEYKDFFFNGKKWEEFGYTK